jgi:hypothetical protein
LKKVLDHDPHTGVTEIFHYDELTKQVHIETQQDVSVSLDVTNILRNDDEYSKEGMKNDMLHFAHIPILVQQKWLNEYGPENDPMRKGNEKLLFRLLNSPDYRYLKTTNKIHLGR